MIHFLRKPYLWLALCFVFIAAHAEFKVPKLSGPVVDQISLLPSQTESSLTQALHSLYDQGGSQIQVLLVPSLEGLTIEQASIQVVDQWKLGDSEKDNGVLLFVAQKERKIRIEVGQGLEGLLTDAYSKRIISEVMVPLFRSGHADSGVLLGVVNIAKYTDPDFDFEKVLGKDDFHSRGQIKRRHSGRSRRATLMIILIFIVIFVLSSGGPGGGRGGYTGYHGGGFGGGGFGGGFGGGGWSGGGGGFSGGGASGGW